MKIRMTTRMAWILLLYPIIVGYTDPQPSKKTFLDIVLGFGSYMDINRDCSGNVISATPNSFFDVGANIRYKNDDLLLIGKAGYLNTQRGVNVMRSRQIVNPDDTYSTIIPTSTAYVGGGLGVEEGGFSIEAGMLYFSNEILLEFSHFQPFGKLRIGRENKFNFSLSLLDDPTFMSYGGPLHMGVGFPINKDGSSTMGIGFGVLSTQMAYDSGLYYDQTQITCRFKISPAHEKYSILINGNAGFAEGHLEYGISFGLRSEL